MSKLTPITSRAKMNGGVIKGKSSCGCGGGCGCGSSPAKQTDHLEGPGPPKTADQIRAKYWQGKSKPTGSRGQAAYEYPLAAPRFQEFGGGAFGALYGGGVKAGANLAMKAAGYLAKSPKTAKIAHSIQNFIKGGTKAKTSSNIRADGFGGRTTVGSRPNYNNRGSN
jgi:hypothetical protein